MTKITQNSNRSPYPYKLPRLIRASKVWYILYYVWNVDTQKLVRKRVLVEGSTDPEREQDASDIIAWVSKELQNGAYVGTPKPSPQPAASDVTLSKNLTLTQAVAYFFQTKRDIADSTAILYTNYSNHFQAFFKERGNAQVQLRQITKPVVLAFMDQVKLAGKTRNNILGFLHSFFEMYVEREVIEKNPAAKIRKDSLEESEDHLPFTPVQIRELKESILERGDEQLWLFCQFIYYTFARPGQEIRLLQVKDLMPTSIRITAKRGKTNRFRYPFLSPALEAEIIRLGLRKYPPDYFVFSNASNSDNPNHPDNFKVVPGPTPPGQNSYYNRHVRHLKKLGLFGKDYDIYSWKPTGVIALWSATLDLKLIQEQCGHSTITQTDRYLRKLGLVIRPEKLNEFPTI